MLTWKGGGNENQKIKERQCWLHRYQSFRFLVSQAWNEPFIAVWGVFCSSSSPAVTFSLQAQKTYIYKSTSLFFIGYYKPPFFNVHYNVYILYVLHRKLLKQFTHQVERVDLWFRHAVQVLHPSGADLGQVEQPLALLCLLRPVHLQGGRVRQALPKIDDLQTEADCIDQCCWDYSLKGIQLLITP